MNGQNWLKFFKMRWTMLAGSTCFDHHLSLYLGSRYRQTRKPEFLECAMVGNCDGD